MSRRVLNLSLDILDDVSSLQASLRILTQTVQGFIQTLSFSSNAVDSDQHLDDDDEEDNRWSEHKATHRVHQQLDEITLKTASVLNILRKLAMLQLDPDHAYLLQNTAFSSIDNCMIAFDAVELFMNIYTSKYVLLTEDYLYGILCSLAVAAESMKDLYSELELFLSNKAPPH